jgi:hypothetical protein
MEYDDMTPEKAAASLDRHLRRFPWYLSTGVGGPKDGEALFVYVKSSKHPELEAISDRWLGYRVIIRPVGSIRAIAGQGRRFVTSR